MNSIEDERCGILAGCVESGRLERAAKLRSKVVTLVAEPELVIAAVGAYNVMIDATARRILHGCRDFHGEASQGRMCKHVAAVLLGLDDAVALPILRDLTAEPGAWSLEVIAARVGGVR